MLSKFETAQSSWRHGAFRIQPGPMTFGQTYEDFAIEMSAFTARSRVFVIAGAGSAARALAAAGHRVTAVDINPRQLAYAESRSRGEAMRRGGVERLLALGRGLAWFAGWSREKIAEFLSLSDCGQQVEFWDRRLDTRIWRTAVDTVLSPRMLGFCYAGPFATWLSSEFGPEIRRRLRRGWANHSNRSNPYAAALLLGTWPADAALPEPRPNAHPIEFVCADAADFLERCPRDSFDAFALSNISDGASSEYQRRLKRAVKHAAAPEAVVVSRTFAEPGPGTEANLAAQDRSMLWGAVRVSSIAEFSKEATA